MWLPSLLGQLASIATCLAGRHTLPVRCILALQKSWNVLFNKNYIKKINLFYAILVNLCMGPLKWIVTFRIVFHSCYEELLKQEAQMAPGHFPPPTFS